MVLVAVLGFPVSIYFWFSKEDWFRKTTICVGLILAVVITIPFSYCRIFIILRRHKKQIQNQNNLATRIQGISHINISKYRKSVLTILYVLVAIVLSYLPGGIAFMIELYFKTELSKFVFNITGTLVLFNSSINRV